MPSTVTLMFWNIQTFGDQMKTRGNYVALCNLIARIVERQQADILAIMELRPGGVAHLPLLTAALRSATGGDWYCDWIKGSAWRDPANSAADLDWDMDHHEGYAVLWNASRSAHFVMTAVPGGYSSGVRSGIGPALQNVPANILGLVLRGRAQGAAQPFGWFDGARFDPASPGSNWAPLRFYRSNMLNSGDLPYVGARRPCYFVMNIQGRAAPNNGPESRLVPVLVYHATFNGRSRSLNTQLAGYSRPLYRIDYGPAGAVTVANTVLAGDFNIDANARNYTQYDAYTVFTNGYGGGGANCQAWLSLTEEDEEDEPDSPRTSVALRESIGGPPILEVNHAEYKRLAIDNIFYRLGPGVTVPLGPHAPYDLFPGVMGGELSHQQAPNLLQDFWDPLAEELGSYFEPFPNYPDRDSNDVPLARRGGVYVPVIGEIESWEHLSESLSRGSFQRVNGVNNNADARTAAEFIHQFVSDHLPVTIRMTFN